MHSKWVWSFNHDITTSLRLCPTPIFQKSTPDLHMPNRVRALYAHPQLSKVLKHFVYICHGMWDGLQVGFWSINHDITTSLRLRPTPIFQKSTPDLHRHNSVRAHPYAHILSISRC